MFPKLHSVNGIFVIVLLNVIADNHYSPNLVTLKCDIFWPYVHVMVHDQRYQILFLYRCGFLFGSTEISSSPLKISSSSPAKFLLHGYNLCLLVGTLYLKQDRCAWFWINISGTVPTSLPPHVLRTSLIFNKGAICSTTTSNGSYNGPTGKTYLQYPFLIQQKPLSLDPVSD